MVEIRRSGHVDNWLAKYLVGFWAYSLAMVFWLVGMFSFYDAIVRTVSYFTNPDIDGLFLLIFALLFAYTIGFFTVTLGHKLMKRNLEERKHRKVFLSILRKTEPVSVKIVEIKKASESKPPEEYQVYRVFWILDDENFMKEAENLDHQWARLLVERGIRSRQCVYSDEPDFYQKYMGVKAYLVCDSKNVNGYRFEFDLEGAV